MLNHQFTPLLISDVLIHENLAIISDCIKHIILFQYQSVTFLKRKHKSANEDNDLLVQWFYSWISNKEIWQLFQTAENNVIFLAIFSNFS